MTRDAELQAVRRQGKRIRTGMLEVRVLASPLLHSRAGIIVPKYKHGAVERNRLKRRLRELARLRLLPALAGGPAVDVVVRALPHAYAADFATLERDVERALRPIAQQARAPRPAAASSPDDAPSVVHPPAEPSEDA